MAGDGDGATTAGRRAVGRLEELDDVGGRAGGRPVLGRPGDEVGEPATRRGRREDLVRRQRFDRFAGAVVEVRLDGAGEEVLEDETVGAVVPELLLRRLVGAQASRRPHRADGPVVEAEGDAVDEVDGEIAVGHVRRDLGDPAPGGPQHHAHRMGHLGLALPAAADRRVGIGRCVRAGHRELEHRLVVVGLAAVVGLDHRGEQPGHVQQLTDARADQVGHALGSARELIGVAEHQVQLTRLGGVDEVPGVRRLEDHRLLEHHVETAVEGRLGQRVVVDMRNGDEHAVDEA